MVVRIEAIDYPKKVNPGGYADITAHLYNPTEYKVMECFLTLGTYTKKSTLGICVGCRMAVKFEGIGPLQGLLEGKVETNQKIGYPPSETKTFTIDATPPEEPKPLSAAKIAVALTAIMGTAVALFAIKRKR